MSQPTTSPSPSALARRYGGPDADLPLQVNATVELMLRHRSVRRYLAEPLPPGTLETLVAVAQSAPTSSNMQAWSVVAVENPDRKRRLAELAGPNPQIEAAPLVLVFVADLARSRAIARANGATGEGLDYLESFLLAALDAAFAAQNAVTALESLGLGSCYIGAMRNRPAEVAAELGLPSECVAVFGLTVGVPDPEAGEDIKPRLAQSAVLHRERYGAPADPRDLLDYDARLRAFQRSQGMAERGWTEVVAGRIGTTEALKSRTRLAEVLRELGFALR